MAEGYIQLNVFDHLISIFTKSGTWGRVGGGGGNSHRLGYQMCYFFRVLFWLKINFWVYFIACNKFWVNILALNKFLGQIVMKHQIKIY